MITKKDYYVYTEELIAGEEAFGGEEIELPVSHGQPKQATTSR